MTDSRQTGRPRLMVTGASGFLGWHVVTAAQADWDVIGVVNRRALAVPGVRTVTVDLTDFAALKALVDSLAPQAVMHLAADADPNRCQLDPDASYRINVNASTNLAGLCADRALSCLFTSTDLVFDGQHAPYREEHSATPVCRYGEQKLEAEQRMRARCPELVICRLPLLYGGAGPAGERGSIRPLIRAFRERRAVSLFTDEFRTPACAWDAAAGLLVALRARQPLLHLGGAERLSRHDFGLRVARRLSADPGLVVAARQTDKPMPAPRPADVSLDSSRAFALGYTPRALDRWLDELVPAAEA